MKKYFLNIIFVSFLFPAYYSIGDTINIEEHLNHPIEICYGTNNLNTGNIITLGDNIGKITVIGLEIPW
mgnify:CR=1 FL=1